MLRNEILSVTEVTQYLKELIEADPVLKNIMIRGELSNFYCHSSGHLYFTLKDSNAQLKCVMFRSFARSLKFRPENGMSLIVTGSLSLYSERGEYQLYVQSLEPDGIGALHLAFQQLKEKLENEGLFSTEVKKPIPRLPRKIGVITSPTGAAIRDIISVITRRFPFVEILIAPAVVQGVDAPASLVRALKILQNEDIDVIIIGRGGGSIEDLWAFNEEIVARAIFASRIPVISAVGHETDFTIADFVADLRAPTPSAAAELAVASYNELSRHLTGLEKRLTGCMNGKIEKLKERLKKMQNQRIFTQPEEVLLKPWQRVDDLEHRLHFVIKQKLNLLKERCRAYSKQLNSLSPLNVLSRGYSLTEKNDGSILKSIQEVEVGDTIKVNLSDGQLIVNVERINEKVRKNI